MKLKKAFIGTAILLCAATLLAEATAPTSNTERRRRRPSKPSGGLIEQKDSIPSKPIAIVNNQNLIAANELPSVVSNARVMASLPFRIEAKNAPASIELVECDCESMIVVMPELFKAKINLKALSADSASPTQVVSRLEKEIVRAGYYLMGSGYGPKGCATAPISTLKELDALDAGMISAEAVLNNRGANKLGIKRIRWLTYRDACQRGVAPEPANAEQKAIWDEVHAIPTEPIKIKPETHPAK